MHAGIGKPKTKRNTFTIRNVAFPYFFMGNHQIMGHFLTAVSWPNIIIPIYELDVPQGSYIDPYYSHPISHPINTKSTSYILYVDDTLTNSGPLCNSKTGT
jgi:hypothetical protein